MEHAAAGPWGLPLWGLEVESSRYIGVYSNKEMRLGNSALGLEAASLALPLYKTNVVLSRATYEHLCLWPITRGVP